MTDESLRHEGEGVEEADSRGGSLYLSPKRVCDGLLAYGQCIVMNRRLERVAAAAYWHRIKHPGDGPLDVYTLSDDEDDFGYVRRLRGHELDIWGRPMRIKLFDEPYVLISSDGPDGERGTEDDMLFSTRGWQ